MSVKLSLVVIAGVMLVKLSLVVIASVMSIACLFQEAASQLQIVHTNTHRFGTAALYPCLSSLYTAMPMRRFMTMTVRVYADVHLVMFGCVCVCVLVWHAVVSPGHV